MTGVGNGAYCANCGSRTTRDPNGVYCVARCHERQDETKKGKFRIPTDEEHLEIETGLPPVDPFVATAKRSKDAAIPRRIVMTADAACVECKGTGRLPRAFSSVFHGDGRLPLCDCVEGLVK